MPARYFGLSFLPCYLEYYWHKLVVCYEILFFFVGVKVYVCCLVMWKVEDIIPKFKNMHELLEVLPSTSSYEKLILHCCGLDKVELFLLILIWSLWLSIFFC